MALDPVVNFFQSEIATLPVASGGTVIVLSSGDGSKLPNPAVDGAFNLTIYEEGNPFSAPEIVRVTGRTSDTLTVTRAQEGTTATTKTSGTTWKVVMFPTAKTIQDIDSTKLDVAGGTMTGDLTIPDKIIHSGDTNTAIRFPSADTFTVETGGVEMMRVNSSGLKFNNIETRNYNIAQGDILILLNEYGVNTRCSFRLFAQDSAARAEIIADIVSDGALDNVAVSMLNNQGVSVNVIKRLRVTYSGTDYLAVEISRNAAGTYMPRFISVIGLISSVFNVIELSEATVVTDLGLSNQALSSYFSDMHIAGDVGIGTNSPATTLDVNGNVTITDKIIHSGDTNTAIRFPSADTFTVETAGAERVRVTSTGNVGIGTTSPATKLDVSGAIRASTGILFGTDTAAANTLDDYERGTFTPTVIGLSTAGTGTYSLQFGRYIKIGKLVTAFVRLTWSAHDGTGNLAFDGLPFTVLNTSGYLASANIGLIGDVSLTANNIPIAFGRANTTRVELFQTPTGGGSALNVPIDTSATINFTVTYETA